ncbi:6909_t:CDS:1, partial [Gigaspora rosea]
PMLNDIANALEALDFLNPMQANKFLGIFKKNIIYEVLSDD